MKKCEQQPFCRYCGKPIRKYSHAVYVHSAHPELARKMRSKAECQRLTNLRVLSVSYSQDTNVSTGEKGPRYVYSYSTWDGETYYDDCFCSNTHAITFARAAAATLSTAAYRAATAKAKTA